MDKSFIDMHFHSNCSDGKLSVDELAEMIKMKNIKYCSLTDHDTIAGVRRLRELLEGCETVVVPGVELTALYNGNEIHILAYDFDVDKVENVLYERNELVKKLKIQEMSCAKKLFAKEDIYVDKNLLPNEKRPVGYTVAMNICQNQHNQEKFLKIHGKELTPDDVYYIYQTDGKTCATKRSGVTFEWLFERLNKVVGDLIVAHPFLQVSVATKPLSEQNIIALINAGLTGVEVYHDKVPDEQISWLETLIESRSISFTGGSDFHGHSKDLDLGMYRADVKVPKFRLKNYCFAEKCNAI